ncbi:MAG: conjugal transfer protein TraN [Gammaproteobacteria bacterium]|nr:conjugal transfer protein TraN [Gammaproteobacteria bacterium]MCD8542220.1 conjugal transfer protein TraN [Gammaproteobacteria bacterium]
MHNHILIQRKIPLKKTDPNSIPGYESNPDQTQYYNGVTQDNTNQMESDAKNYAAQSETAQIINNSYLNNNATMNTNSDMFQNSQSIENNSSNYVNNDQFCMDGNCTDKSYTQSGSFNDAMSALNAEADAESYQNPDSIFNGTSESCHEASAGYNDCCKDSGWGHDINLAHCSAEEKELGEKKEKGLTVYVGEYCSKKVFGVCTEHKKGYCAFQSTLARIVQTDGRQKQLGISFGSGKHPNCRGLTVEELQQVDFAEVDFSDYYTELNSNADQPPISEDQAHIEEGVSNCTSSGCTNE